MKKIILILLIFGNLNIISFGKEKINIRVTEYAPCYFKGIDGKWQGIDVELVEAVIKKAGYDVDYIEMPWSRALDALEKGTIDILMNVSMTEERKKIMNFIGPERYGQMGLIVKKENSDLKITNYDSFKEVVIEKGKKIGIQSDVFYGEEFNKKLEDPTYYEYFMPTFKTEVSIKLLNNGRILGFIEDKTSLSYLIKNHPDYESNILHPFDGFPKEALYFAISKKVPQEKYNKLKEAFEILEKDGTLDEIRKKYHWIK